ncbi:hypothetical protein TNIN_366821 [Trichonephila inaurata madagascariensis]|uniref:Uncharacterized protein n=1 Tax=Trichonephila inaurata madagascariensis TaxID=2747483 RepID=A0A8X6ITV9_9ARAC|nr:hypothetical protein TNIN_366821 [Trichonephila inaurata madagascariensis]
MELNSVNLYGHGIGTYLIIILIDQTFNTSDVRNCERLQIANSEIRKFAILHANVSHAIEAAAPYAQDDDSDSASTCIPDSTLLGPTKTKSGKIFLFTSLQHPGCRIHNTPG